MTAGVAETLSALADGTRRAVIEALADGRLSAGELADRLDVSPAAISRHLRVLRDTGLVDVALDPGDTRRHIYATRPDPLRELADWVGEVAGFWDSQLESFRRHTEPGRAR